MNSAFATPPALEPNSITGLRNDTPAVPSGAFLLGFQAVNPLNEDRTISHFAIDGLGPVTNATLSIPVEELDPGLPLGVFDVYYFYGDGTVSADEWDFGTLLQSLTNVDGDYSDLFVDVTGILNAGIQQNKSYLSFNFRAGSGSDRYILGAGAGIALPDSSIAITPVPEPSTLVLLTLGTITILFAPRKFGR